MCNFKFLPNRQRMALIFQSRVIADESGEDANKSREEHAYGQGNGSIH